MLLIANSLIDGFFNSNGIGQGIVIAQLIGSVTMVAAIIGKGLELSTVSRVTRRFLRDFATGADVLEYYLKRRPTAVTGLESIYRETCERILKILSPDMRSSLSGRAVGINEIPVLTNHEIELVRGTCEHALDEEEIRVEHGMGIIATVVTLSPMLGLLGTVWGVLDAFAAMGEQGTASLAALAPSIASALVTTVVGLLIAIPGVIAFSRMNATIRNVTSDMEGFADELIGRVACEYQGRGV